MEVKVLYLAATWSFSERLTVFFAVRTCSSISMAPLNWGRHVSLNFVHKGTIRPPVFLPVSLKIFYISWRNSYNSGHFFSTMTNSPLKSLSFWEVFTTPNLVSWICVSWKKSSEVAKNRQGTPFIFFFVTLTCHFRTHLFTYYPKPLSRKCILVPDGLLMAKRLWFIP